MLIASAVLPVWQAVLLIILSFGSLAIALYCLLFMVPLKKFVQRIESLGGGMEGIKKHLRGVETHFEKELQRIESSQNDRIDRISGEGEQRFDTAENQVKNSLESIKRLEDSLKAVEESLEAAHSRLEEDMNKHADVDGRLRELRRDMAVQAEETEGKLQKEVKESFYELEATILSTLEVLRDELLPPKKEKTSHEPGPVFSQDRPKRGSRTDNNSDADSKIISAGPLFSRSETPKQHPEGPGDDDDQRKT